MKLESQDHLCVVCLIEEEDQKRDDHLCRLCGQVSDKYNTDPDNLELEQ